MESAATIVKRNPWGSLPAPATQPCSFSSLMDEDLARKLQVEEGGIAEPPGPTVAPEEQTVVDDLLLAQTLQHEFDKENDIYLAAKEKHINGNSKVGITFLKYKSVHPTIADDEEEPNPYDLLEDVKEKPQSGVSHGGTKSRRHRRSKNTADQPTKHDLVACGRKNVQNIERQFPVGFQAGDVADERSFYRLSNPVYNSLKAHAESEEHKSKRLHEKKEHSTHDKALDEKTRLVLFKLVNNGLLEEINGTISTGKEACVYHAFGGKTAEEAVPKEVALKVYKTTLNEFKTRDKYIKDDHRFKARFKKQNPRKVIHLWAEKEMRNLKRLSDGGVPCPAVVQLKKHVLVMQFIGKDGCPAPKLNQVELSEHELGNAYRQVVAGMKKMFKRCRLVHSDLSPYNILWYNGEAVFIDVGQAVDATHPHSMDFLLRDCTKISDFFSKHFLPEVGSPHELFNDITGLTIQATSDQEFLVKARSFQKDFSGNEHTKTEPDSYGFDYYFELSREESLSDEDSESDNLVDSGAEDNSNEKL